MKANEYRILKRRIAYIMDPLNITLQIFFTNLKIKTCEIVKLT